MKEHVHMRFVWQCCDCGHYSSSGVQCACCASKALWPVNKLLDRVLSAEKGRAA